MVVKILVTKVLTDTIVNSVAK